MCRAYSLDLRERVVSSVAAGQSCRAVAAAVFGDQSKVRYQGLTFYQSQMAKSVQLTGLEVVRNPSRQLPYISCILMGLGLVVGVVSLVVHVVVGLALDGGVVLGGGVVGLAVAIGGMLIRHANQTRRQPKRA